MLSSPGRNSMQGLSSGSLKVFSDVHFSMKFKSVISSPSAMSVCIRVSEVTLTLSGRSAERYGNSSDSKLWKRKCFRT